MANTLTPANPSEDWRDQTTWPLHKTKTAATLEVIFSRLLPLKFKLRTSGIDHIPLTGAAVVAPNHISGYDPMLVSLAIYPRRQLFFMAKKELYKNPVVGWCIRNYGAFPVNRGERDLWAVQHASRVLYAHQLLCLFPEGTRSKNQGKLGRGKTGTVKLALEHQVPVIPTAIIGSHLAKPNLQRALVEVKLGEPIDFNAMAGPPPYEYHAIRDLSRLLMERLAAMLPPEMRGHYA